MIVFYHQRIRSSLHTNSLLVGLANTCQSVERTLLRCWQSTEPKLRQIFGDYGTVTDCALKYTKEGVFRRFAYIGYVSELEAKAALDSLNHTYIDTSKIQVGLSITLFL